MLLARFVWVCYERRPGVALEIWGGGGGEVREVVGEGGDKYAVELRGGAHC